MNMSPASFWKTVKLIVKDHCLSQANCKLVEFWILSQKQNSPLLTTCVYTDFAIKCKNMKNFNRAKDMIECQMAKTESAEEVLFLLGTIRKFSRCKTSEMAQDFSQKFIDMIQHVLKSVNDLKTLGDSESRVAAMCVHILCDLVQIGILEQLLIGKILLKKYERLFSKLLESTDSQRAPLVSAYVCFLCHSRHQLEEFEIEKGRVYRFGDSLSVEDRDALTVF